MAFLFGRTSGSSQALDRELAPHKALFRNYERTKEDMTSLLQQFPNLTPTMHNFGGLKSFSATGTVPITYKGAKYSVLLSIWLSFDYPNVAPNVSAIPTDNLVVPANHSFVSEKGHVDFAKLEFMWDPSYHLVFLLETLQQAFGREPPLRQRPVAPPPSYTASRNPGTSHIQTQQPPTYSSPSAMQTSPSPSPSPNYQVSTSSTSPAPNHPYPNGNGSSSMPALQPTIVQPHTSVSTPANSNQMHNQLDELLEITATQLVSVYDEMHGSESALSQIATNTLNEWNDKHTFVKYKLEQAKETRAQCEAASEQLAAEVECMKGIIATRQAEAVHGKIDYDAIAEPADPILRTALACHSKDLAIEDMQYYLDKALQNGAIDLKQFLKSTRDLATEQYYQRALLRKLNVHVPSYDTH